MTKQDEVKQAVQSVIKEMMDRVMNNVLIKDPFVKENHRAEKPLYAALVPDEIFKGSHFERRFVTPFGYAWELLAMAVAKTTLRCAERGTSIKGIVKSERLRRIQEVLNWLEHAEKDKERKRPSWDTELKYVLEGTGDDIPVTVICDLYMKDKVKKLIYGFELKAPLPNSDQTKVSKEKLLKL